MVPIKLLSYTGSNDETHKKKHFPENSLTFDLPQGKNS